MRVALARYLEFYGGAADKVHGETHPVPARLHRSDAARAARRHRPHRAVELPDADHRPLVGAALAMGNACVLKPAEEACLTALAFARIAQRGRAAGRRAQRRARARRGGRRGAVARIPASTTCRSPARWRSGALVQAAAATNAVPVTLELGGKSPQIVFADADLDAALPFLVNAGIQNAGQTCSAASRILVERPRLRRGASRAWPSATGRCGSARRSTTSTSAR